MLSLSLGTTLGHLFRCPNVNKVIYFKEGGWVTGFSGVLDGDNVGRRAIEVSEASTNPGQGLRPWRSIQHFHILFATGEFLEVLNGHLPGSCDSLASVSQVAGTTGTCNHIWLIFIFLVEMGFDYVSQDDLNLLTS